MSKVGSDSSPLARTRAGRNYWVRANLDAKIPECETRASAKVRKQRFVEPVRLSDEQRAGIIAALEQAELGDVEGRELFVAAMEYDLAECRKPGESEMEAEAAKSEPEPHARNTSLKQADIDDPLNALAATAQAMVSCIADLDATSRERLLRGVEASDPFRRGYKEAYLSVLQTELARLATIGKPPRPTPETPVPKKQDKPVLTSQARRFIARAADAFRDCFEQEPTAKRAAPFPTALKAVVSVSGIPVPTDPETLREVLGKR
jgi:hypothetical protein